MSEIVSGKAYEAAVKGRQEFRAAYRKALADIKSLRAQLKTAVWADSAECKMLNKENAKLRARIADLEAALIDARDTFSGDENDDRYWAWFNRHEDKAFAGLSLNRPEKDHE